MNNENHEVKTVNTRLNYESSEIDQSGLNNNNSNTQSSRIVAYSQKSNLEINSAQKSHANPTFTSLGKYFCLILLFVSSKFWPNN